MRVNPHHRTMTRTTMEEVVVSMLMANRTCRPRLKARGANATNRRIAAAMASKEL